MSDSVVSKLQEWSKIIPFWFALIAGLIYGTGFLIEYSFFNSIGIRESAEEIFKARYIYTGVLCLYVPVNLGILVLGTIYAKARPENNKRIYWPTISLLIMLLAIIYFLIAFSDPGFFHYHKIQIITLFSVTIIGLVIVRGKEEAEDKNGGGKGTVNSRRVNRRLLFIGLGSLITLWFFFDIIKSFSWKLDGDIVKGELFYLFLLGMAGIIIGSIIVFRAKGMALVLSLCLPFALIYFSTLVFAYKIYPYMPASRGGGDYSRGERASVLVFDSRYLDSLPEELIDQTDSLFSVDDFLDAHGLINRLCAQQDIMSIYLWKLLSDDTKQVIKSQNVIEEKRIALIENLDTLLRGESLYNQNMFSTVALSSQVLHALKTVKPSSRDMIRLNRLLLEASFPHELRKSGTSPHNKCVSWPVTILDETSSTLFITMEISKWDHQQWRKMGPESKPKQIFAIRRDQIITIIHHREIPDLQKSGDDFFLNFLVIF